MPFICHAYSLFCGDAKIDFSLIAFQQGCTEMETTIFVMLCLSLADHSGRAVQGMNRLRPLEH
jgi:hypothetical protein